MLRSNRLSYRLERWWRLCLNRLYINWCSVQLDYCVTWISYRRGNQWVLGSAQMSVRREYRTDGVSMDALYSRLSLYDSIVVSSLWFVTGSIRLDRLSELWSVTGNVLSIIHLISSLVTNQFFLNVVTKMFNRLSSSLFTECQSYKSILERLLKMSHRDQDTKSMIV